MFYRQVISPLRLPKGFTKMLGHCILGTQLTWANCERGRKLKKGNVRTLGLGETLLETTCEQPPSLRTVVSQSLSDGFKGQALLHGGEHSTAHVCSTESFSPKSHSMWGPGRGLWQTLIILRTSSGSGGCGIYSSGYNFRGISTHDLLRREDHPECG